MNPAHPTGFLALLYWVKHTSKGTLQSEVLIQFGLKETWHLSKDTVNVKVYNVDSCRSPIQAHIMP